MPWTLSIPQEAELSGARYPKNSAVELAHPPLYSPLVLSCPPSSSSRACSLSSIGNASFGRPVISPLLSYFSLPTVNQPERASNARHCLSKIQADSVELPWSEVSASNEAINKSTALTGLSTLFVRDDVSIPLPWLLLSVQLFLSNFLRSSYRMMPMMLILCILAPFTV